MLYRLARLAPVLALTWTIGCTPSTEEAGGPKADPQEWAWLEQAKPNLDAVRSQLRDLSAQQVAAATEEDKAALAEQITAKEGELATLVEEFSGRLVGYINSLEIPQGEPLTPEQLAAIRLKSSEDLETAREWIDKGGDYARAIDIYNQQLLWDPENAELKAALATAEELRFMSPERFATVTKGMTQDEVRAALGPVHLRNARVDEEKNVTSWLYRTADGGAAGVFFKRNPKSEVWVVYDTRFEYVKPQVVGAPAQAAEEPPASGT
jgi:hypothetical protein